MSSVTDRLASLLRLFPTYYQDDQQKLDQLLNQDEIIDQVSSCDSCQLYFRRDQTVCCETCYQIYCHPCQKKTYQSPSCSCFGWFCSACLSRIDVITSSLTSSGPELDKWGRNYQLCDRCFQIKLKIIASDRPAKSIQVISQ